MAAWKRLYRQVDPLMSLQIVITIEGLWALVALEWAVVLGLLALGVVPIHLGVMLWVTLHVHSSDQRHLVSGVVHVGHDGPSHHCW